MILIKKKSTGIISSILEKCTELLIRSQCQRIDNINIEITTDTKQIFKGLIKEINITAQDVSYKELIFDEIELLTSNLKIRLKAISKEVEFENNFIINFKLSLSANSLKKILLSESWKWIGENISKEICNCEQLDNITINKNQIEITGLRKKDMSTTSEIVDIRSQDGNFFLVNKLQDKYFSIPIEEKIFINSIVINNDRIIIFGNSSVSF